MYCSCSATAAATIADSAAVLGADTYSTTVPLLVLLLLVLVFVLRR
jgi:hypothetical protein